MPLLAMYDLPLHVNSVDSEWKEKRLDVALIARMPFSLFAIPVSMTA